MCRGVEYKCRPPSWIEKSFSTQQLIAYNILMSFAPWKEKNRKTKNATNTWLARTKRGFGGSVLKVVETEKPSWKPSPAPTPKPHFSPGRGENQAGDKGAACRLLTPDFLNGIKSSGRRAELPSRSQLADSANKK